MRTLLVAAGARTLAEDPPGPAPRALVIDGETVVWVGADPAQATPHDRAVDLGGAWITPAFVDAHVHATATGLALRGVDLDGAGSAAEALDRLRRHAEAHADDAVIIGVRWDDLRWPEGRPMTATEVSAAARGRTVLLNRVDAHSCVVDAGTLARLPLERLEGVDRDAAGAPTGWLVEAASQAARALVYGELPAVQLAAARDAVCARAAGLGIGSLHEMGHPGLSSLEDARTWAQGSWPIEVLVWWADLDAAVSAENGLRPGGDLFLDGSIGSRTAAVSFGYRGGGHGTLFHDDQAVAAFFGDCTAAGRAAGVHAIGDRAIEQAVAALEAAAERHGIDAVRRCRHRVEHVELPRQDHIARLAALGVVASVQPVFDALWGGEGQLYDERFGADVALGSNPFALLHAAGIPLAFGSDSTVTPLDPWGAVHAAERHRGGQGVDRLTALRAHVAGGRLAAGQPDGALRAGGQAALAVWNDDPLTVSDPQDLECLATIVVGRTAHGDLVVG